MQHSNSRKGLFFGYKPHVIVDADTGASLAVDLIPANTNDKKMFAYCTTK
ncbi:MAG: transposase [Candidatus Micrarchaeaceae archaeon]